MLALTWLLVLLPAQARPLVAFEGPTGVTGQTGQRGPRGPAGPPNNQASVTCNNASFARAVASATTAPSCSVPTGDVPTTTRTLFVSALDFVPSWDGSSSVPWTRIEQKLYRSAAGQTSIMLAPLRLPQGALPVEANCLVSDYSPTAGHLINLMLLATTKPGTVLPCSSLTSTVTGTTNTVVASSCTTFVANADATSPTMRSFFIQASTTSATTFGLELFGCKVKYEIQTLGN